MNYMKYILMAIGLLALIVLIPILVILFNIFGARDYFLNAINPVDIIEFDSSVEVRPEVDSHPLLDETQEGYLETIGIDPATLPTEITPAMEECGLEALGETRVQELLNGATPTLNDILAAQHCLE